MKTNRQEQRRKKQPKPILQKLHQMPTISCPYQPRRRTQKTLLATLAILPLITPAYACVPKKRTLLKNTNTIMMRQSIFYTIKNTVQDYHNSHNCQRNQILFLNHCPKFVCKKLKKTPTKPPRNVGANIKTLNTNLSA